MEKRKRVWVTPTKGFPLHEPFQNITIPVGDPRQLELTSWVEEQIRVGLLKEVEGRAEDKVPLVLEKKMKVTVRRTHGRKAK